MATDAFTGPVDCLVFSFPPGARADVGLQLLLDRVDAGAVELLDLECIGVGAEGQGTRLPLSTVHADGGPDLSAFDGVESLILEQDDLDEIASDLEPGGFAVAVVYEERSLSSVASAWAAAGGTLLLSGGVDIVDLEHAIEHTGSEGGEV